MNMRTILLAGLCIGLSLEVTAQQTKPTQSGTKTGSAQAGNEKPVGGTVKRQAKRLDRRVNTNTTNSSATKTTSSASQGSMKGTENPGSSGRASQRRTNQAVPEDE